MTHVARRGADGTPLEDESTVFRLIMKPMDYEINGRVIVGLDRQFEPTSQDKKHRPVCISVYEESLTTPTQAAALMDTGKVYELAAHMAVVRIRSIRPEPDDPSIRCLDVIWDAKTIVVSDIVTPDQCPGVQGHAGITGLDRPPDMPRLAFKTIRECIAKLASEDLREMTS